MNQAQIIQMALEAGLTEPDFGDWMIDYGYAEDQITKFAELVRAATKEEDAKICEISDELQDWEILGGEEGRELCNGLALAIRASK